MTLEYYGALYQRLCTAVEVHGWKIGLWLTNPIASEKAGSAPEWELRVWDKSFSRRTVIKDGLENRALDGAAARLTHQLIKAGKLPS